VHVSVEHQDINIALVVLARPATVAKVVQAVTAVVVTVMYHKLVTQLATIIAQAAAVVINHKLAPVVTGVGGQHGLTLQVVPQLHQDVAMGQFNENAKVELESAFAQKYRRVYDKHILCRVDSSPL
jgi:phage tail tube protein FII